MSHSPLLAAMVLNAALLLLVVLVLDLMTTPRQVEALQGKRVLYGMLLGSICIALMMAPLVLVDGVIFDVRSVLLAISGLFFGALPTTVAMAMAAAYRLSLGGAGAWGGVLVILTSGLLGLAWRRWRCPQAEAIDWRELLLLGIVVHLAMLGELTLVLWDIAERAVVPIILPVLLIHPLLTVVLGLALARRAAYQAGLRALRQSEMRYHSLFDNSHTVMLIVDPADGRIVAANPAAENFYGWSRQQLTDMRMAEINTLTPEAIRAEMQQALTGRNNRFEFRHRRADGSECDVEVFSGPIVVGEKQLLYSIIHDSSERKAAERSLELSEATRAAAQALALEEQRQARIAALNLMEDALAEKVRAEASLAQLEESRERLNLALQAANQGIYDLNVQTGAAIVSPEYATMLGYDPAGFIETNAAWIERLHPEDHDRVARVYRDYVEGKIPEYVVEFRQRAASGAWKWILSVGKLVERDADGRPLRMLGTHTDITERKQNEQMLALQKRRGDALLALPAAAESRSETEFMQYAMDQAEQLTGSRIAFIHFVNDDQETIELVAWSRATLANYCRAAFDSHYPIGQAGIWADALRRRKPVVFNDYAAVTHKHGLPEGHSHLERLISVPVVEGGLVRLMAGVGNKPEPYTGTDVETVRILAEAVWRIVHQRRADAALMQSEQMFRSLFENNMDGVLLTTDDGEILAANPAARQIFGRSEDELRAIGRSGVVDASDPSLARLLAEREQSGRVRGVLRLIGAGDRSFPAELSSLVFAGRDGRRQTSMIVRDISDRVAAAEKIQQQLKELRQWYEVTLGRENRVMELKAEVNALQRRLGEAPRYASVEPAAAAAGTAPPTASAPLPKD